MVVGLVGSQGGGDAAACMVGWLMSWFICCFDLSCEYYTGTSVSITNYISPSAIGPLLLVSHIKFAYLHT